MENKLKVWLARDKDNRLFAFSERPHKVINYWWFDVGLNSFELDCTKFPSVKWEDDEPTEAYITLANEPQSKKEIDWEQRRYEIVKSIGAAKYSRPTVKSVLLNVNQIISAADAIINELKKQSK